ncbi:ATP-binding protein [Flavobacterium sp. NRK F7]|uniref:ATP-binding protein n=1 Tax=Flavobacterium sp. NRK F7 TaxID=2954930 RepID=UPI0020912329|nr:ATP-binding protein [Flavobacterium sp. NRK F7]MCO6163159.1 ATP-binding protein [Flavobacterium sp. NRK F7]
MIFKDIVNKDIVNLLNCEDEPIHIPGLIQPHGFLIAVDSTTHIITVCSENINQFLTISYEQVLGKKIEELFNEPFLVELNLYQSENTNQTKVFNFTIDKQLFSISMHASVGKEIIIEAELTENQFFNTDNLYNSSKQLLSYIEDSFTLKELTNAVAVAIKKITNYDRVMVYRFDADYNGEVIAESKEEHLESFLGLHYPHTDIPVQARELYIKNHLRIIGDVNYKPVPLYTFSDSNLETLDMSLSVLRSVSPIHIQYLHNMGVGATLTISLLHKGKLWGLITCHHYSPKYLSQEIRNTVKLHGHFITSQIDVRLLNEEYEIARKTNQAVENLISKQLDFDRSSITQLFQDVSIIALCNSAGISALIDDQIYTYGNTPNHQDIKRLSIFLSHYTEKDHFSTNALSRITKDLPFISDEFPGINYHFIGNDNDCIIWYRKQTITDIYWAGDPKKSIEKDKNGLSPRKSFEKFTESVKDSSKPWLKSELTASHNFFNFFQIHLRSILLNEEKENQKKLSEILKETNAELENINWISTHDLQEPLRKIRMMASMLVGDDIKELPKDVQLKIIKMQNSAERMQILISDILKYTKTTAQHSDLEIVDLNVLLQEIKEEVKDPLEDNEGELLIGELPTIKGVGFLLKQLFTNIIYNSLKFKSEFRKPIISIRENKTSKDKHQKSGNYYKIEIEDNGIGFDNEYRQKIFKIFSRLNDKNEYLGSGIGLALCKKIMTKHNGLIAAEGQPGKGTIIKIYFPKI